MKIKDTLNTEKSKLDTYYELSKTDKKISKQLTDIHAIIDIYKPLRYEIERSFNAKPVTNAWMKYWEIYHQYGLIPDPARNHGQGQKFTAFFNAELPGAALCALNHYMKTLRPGVTFDWWASSLAPEHIIAPDSREAGLAQGSLITTSAALGDTYGLYEMNRDRWLMGDNNGYVNNGDATILDNLLDFAARIGPNSTVGGVDLYSHDAGIDVSDDFNNQELANAQVHLGCAIAGFLTLKVGGAFIAKQYTYFEAFTHNLIIIYATMFEEFYLCKPLTSRPYNSEIYLIGKGFKGMSNEIYTLLTTRLVNFNTSPFVASELFAAQSMEPLIRFARVIFGQQAHVLGENIGFINEYRNDLRPLREGLEALKRERARFWLQCYPVLKIQADDNLPSNV